MGQASAGQAVLSSFLFSISGASARCDFGDTCMTWRLGCPDGECFASFIFTVSRVEGLFASVVYFSCLQGHAVPLGHPLAELKFQHIAHCEAGMLLILLLVLFGTRCFHFGCCCGGCMLQGLDPSSLGRPRGTPAHD